jgi:hypothetical protein
MSLFHAVVRTDHQSAEVMQFDADQVLTQKLKAHVHETPQHNSGVRTEHEFFGSVCDALDGISEVLVTGSHTAVDDFRHYVDKHRPHVAKHVVGYEVVDHPTENQSVALARKFFANFNQMAGRPSNG